ncbi:inosine/xanthosine triphosphatase [Mariniblastus fucicola]|uniref:Probable inosine/xanthosine triphosphatase n=1 Tax=Mariniblastus fucicola TaxID=980251 RepID=A0A5B9P3Z4_9BACT|nr:inosine/xanthosine triphosphatase [Mariniblastus fucicola]QEG20199.1 Non-canonical purine NTP phosphatase [Mariniblastus fucicola]
MSESVSVAVGSLNPVKINAVRGAFVRQWPDASVVGAEVDTGVSEMPMSDEECLAGARNRAKLAREANDSDFGVGLEGGVNLEATGLMLLGWVVIIHRDGTESVSCTSKIPLPKMLADRILAGEELGPVMDDVLKVTGTAKKGGASGALTAGLVMRQDKFEMAVAYGLAPFVAPQFYQPDN